ncbi:hypothetical protein ACVWY5_003427 [Bradyrhizobium sp. USDA 3256]
MASDTAQPSIVAGATTADGAAVGPVQLHGAGPYSRTPEHVKRQNPATLPCRSYWSERSILAVTISPTLSGRRLVR